MRLDQKVNKRPKKLYILYDGRAHTDVDSASVMETAHSEEECWEADGAYGDGCLWYEYDIINGSELINGKPRPDLYTH